MKKLLLLLAIPIILAGASCVTDEPTSPDVEIEDEYIVEPEKTCEDQCGDGVCAEIVCMAIGCPCAETPENCPEDCKE